LGSAIELGRLLVEQTNTHPLTKPYVGNALKCTSCHLSAGTDSQAASFIGVATAYPAWSPREERVITLEDRILNCFMRSCHGVRPPLGSQASVAIAAYITWLSSEEPIRMNPTRPAGPRALPSLPVIASQANRSRGAAIYTTRCAECHGTTGEGSDANPPVWGPQSFNDGAGLANVSQLAAWLKVAMPLGKPDLTATEALDLAGFIASQPRPHFELRHHLPSREHLGTYNSAP
jgi:thiosulfate dehydrogenase